MNLPKHLCEMFAKKFTADEVAIIDKNWDTYIQISLSNATTRELNASAKAVLSAVNNA